MRIAYGAPEVTTLEVVAPLTAKNAPLEDLTTNPEQRCAPNAKPDASATQRLKRRMPPVFSVLKITTQRPDTLRVTDALLAHILLMLDPVAVYTPLS